MLTHMHRHDLHFDQAGTGPTFLFLHDDPARQAALFRDCSPLATSRLRVVVALLAPAANGSAQVIALLKQLGIGRAVVIAIGKANHTLVDLLDKHPERIAAASFVADQALTRELRQRTANPRSRALLRSGHRSSVAKGLRSASSYCVVQAWAARLVDSCRAGIKNCSWLLAHLDLPGMLQFDHEEDHDEVVTDCL